jgi:hypothetical protein
MTKNLTVRLDSELAADAEAIARARLAEKIEAEGDHRRARLGHGARADPDGNPPGP